MSSGPRKETETFEEYRLRLSAETREQKHKLRFGSGIAKHVSTSLRQDAKKLAKKLAELDGPENQFVDEYQ